VPWSGVARPACQYRPTPLDPRTGTAQGLRLDGLVGCAQTPDSTTLLCVENRDAAFPIALIAWLDGNQRDFPWRASRNPFHVLVAEILLQRTASGKVEPVWREVLRRYPTAGHLRRARETTLAQLIRPLGLIQRSGQLRRLALDLEVRYGGEVPDKLQDLLSLPGVGPYIASAVRSLAFETSDPMVDTVTSRVVKRFFGLPGRADQPDSTVRGRLAPIFARAPEHARKLNLALLDVAAGVCRPVLPRCGQCPLAAHCASAGRRYDRGGWRTSVLGTQ
jgi:A/G-specific adenine glycosylase